MRRSSRTIGEAVVLSKVVVGRQNAPNTKLAELEGTLLTTKLHNDDIVSEKQTGDGTRGIIKR